MASLQLKATNFARAIDLDRAAKKLQEHESRRSRNRTVYRLGEKQYVVLFSFGVVAFLGTTAAEEKLVLRLIRSALLDPEEKGWSDTYLVDVDPTLTEAVVEFERVRIPTLTMDHADLICRVLAQSVAISQFDIGIDEKVQRFQSIHDGLRTSGRLRMRPREILRMIGENHTILRVVIADLSILNVPQVTWQSPQLEQLWLDLRELFDLTERFERLEFKVGYLRETTDQLLNIVQARRMEIMEFAIVIFFIIDLIILFLELLK